MMSRVVVHASAQADIDAIHDYIGIENHSLEAAAKFVSDLHDRFEAYARQPMMGSLCEDLGTDLRCFSFCRNYVVIYRPLDDGIDVLRVFHTARDYGRLFRDDRP
jgi:toxin ParE1/3/4